MFFMGDLGIILLDLIFVDGDFGVKGPPKSFFELVTRDFNENLEHLAGFSSQPHLFLETLTGFGVKGLKQM